MVRSCTIVLAGVLALLPTGDAWANEPLTPRQRQRAKDEFAAGKASFSSGNYRDALSHYRRAYRISRLPGLLFNIAQCHRNLQEYGEAASVFRRYLDRLPDAPNRAAVEALLPDLEQRARDSQRAGDSQADLPTGTEGDGPEVTPAEEPRDPPAGQALYDEDLAAGHGALVQPPPPPPTSTPIYQRWWFWTAVVAAVGGGVAGVYFGTRTGAGLPDTRFPVFDVSINQ